jgi:hypothetical protein
MGWNRFRFARKRTTLLTLVFFGITFFLFSQRSAGAEDFLAEGYKLFFKHHPAADQPVSRELYPFQGPLIAFGEDLQICPAAKAPAAYLHEKSMKYLSHGKDGWLFRTVDFRTDFTLSAPSQNYFNRLNRMLAQKGQTLVIFFGPPRALMETQHIAPADIPEGYVPSQAHRNYDEFLQHLKDLRIKTAGIESAPKGFDYFYKGDLHWTPSGADYAAWQLAEIIKQLPVYNGLKKHEFEITTTGLGIPARGRYESALQRICKINIEATASHLWATNMKVPAGETDKALLDDTDFPDIVVVGTSYSAEDTLFNFTGALKRHLHADVYNAALTGGGFGASALRYYASDVYHAHPPKIIVWEFLSQHDFNNPEAQAAFRQMLPAIEGACAQKEALATYSGEVTNIKTEIFNAMINKPLENTYIYLEVTNPEGRHLETQILYTDGSADKIDLTRSTRAADNGKYYLDLDGTDDRKALFFHIITDKPSGHIAARLCRYSATPGKE